VPRATPLPPDERRAAIVAATLPLLVRHGRDVSTRQIAEAAGVAEGTIFRVFETKDALIDATLDDVFDPAPTCAELLAIDVALPLKERMTRAVAVLQNRMATVFGVFHALRLTPRPAPEHIARQRQEEAMVTAAIEAVLEPDRHRLGVELAVAAALVRTVTFSVTHPMLSQLPHDRPEMVVDLLLHGLHVRTAPASGPTATDSDRRIACSSVS
jgi:AcrR family transcriptional regulator